MAVSDVDSVRTRRGAGRGGFGARAPVDSALGVDMKLQGKIAITMLLPLAGLLAIVVSQDLRLTRQRSIDTGSMVLRDRAINAANLLDGQFRRIAQVADTAAIAVQDVHDWNRDELLGLAHGIVARDPVILGFGTAWESDVVPGIDGPFLGFARRTDAGIEEDDLSHSFDYQRDPLYVQARQGRNPFWSAPFFDEHGAQAEIVMYLSPIRVEGRFLGVTTVDVDAAAFKELAHRIGLSGRPWLVVDSEGVGIAASAESAAQLVGMDSIRGVPLAPMFRSQDGERAASILESLGDDDAIVSVVEPTTENDEAASIGTRVAAVARVRATDWLLVMGEPLATLVDPADRLVQGRAIQAALVVVAALAVVLFGAWWAVLRPVRRIVEAVRLAAEGDASARAGLSGADELAVLGRAIDEAIPRLDELAGTRAAIENARQVQEAMLPSSSLVTDRVHIAGHVRPSDETGGDYYDHGIVGDDVIVFGLGDATGHGLPSALFATTARAYVRASVHQPIVLSDAVAEANRLLAQDSRGGLFMVLFIATWDPATSILRVGSAGHPGWLLRHDDDEYRMLEAPGVPLGVLSDATFDTNEVTGVGGGDLVLVASDGAWEVRNPAGDQLGVEALLDRARRIRDLPPDEQVRRLFEFVREFAGGRPLDDDCTIVIARFD